MIPRQVQLIQQSWEQINQTVPDFGNLFYEQFFSRDKAIEEKFRISKEQQAVKLMGMIDYIVFRLDHLEHLLEDLRQLARTHASYGVERSDYIHFRAAFVSTLATHLNTGWTTELSTAWADAIDLLANAMTDFIDATKSAPAPKTAEGRSYHEVFYVNEQRTVRSYESETLLETSLREHLQHMHACGGNGECSTCRIIVEEGIEYCSPRTPKEVVMANKYGLHTDIRLACQTQAAGPIRIRRPVIDQMDIELLTSMVDDNVYHSAGEERNLAILFCDIEDYTVFTESTQRYDLIHVLNRYYHTMGRVIEQHHGKILDYYGDGFLAIFEKPVPTTIEANAVTAGLELFQALDSFNTYLEMMLGRRFNVRVGVATGKVILGTVGLTHMKKFSAFGDAVNVASRIEGANKQFGTRFLVSEPTYTATKSLFDFGREVEVELKGKSGTHKLFEVLGKK